jgi:hypothetical protein
MLRPIQLEECHGGVTLQNGSDGVAGHRDRPHPSASMTAPTLRKLQPFRQEYLLEYLARLARVAEQGT